MLAFVQGYSDDGYVTSVSMSFTSFPLQKRTEKKAFHYGEYYVCILFSVSSNSGMRIPSPISTSLSKVTTAFLKSLYL